MPLRQSFHTIFSLLFLATINSGITQAQVIPDGTLPTSVEKLGNMDKITGGERVGNNLFHSFEQFSITEGMKAIFDNDLDIENIFTRITGSETSLIDGLLKTAGGANFFLVNPNGIVFGENARLDVGGSFMATTADRIDFADGTSFIAKDNNPNVTLTVSVPVGLGFLGNNGSITVNGSGNQIIDDSNLSPIKFAESPSGISIDNGKTLALVGNGIDFNGGVLSAEDGEIYLTSVESGLVEIGQTNNRLTLINDSVNNHKDIIFNQQSLVEGNVNRIATIYLTGRNINISDGSVIFAKNQGSLSSGSINIIANGSLILSGKSSDGEISSNIRSENTSDAKGQGVSIDISAQKIILQENAKIQTFTSANAPQAIGGNINIEVLNKIELDRSTISSLTLGKGKAGNINLRSSQLELKDISVLSSTSFGEGNGGTITINSNLIELIGRTSAPGGRTNISASTFNIGNAGNLIINTDILRIMDGSSISSSSFAGGNAGNVILDSSKLVEVSGLDENFRGTSANQSTIRAAVQAASPTGQKAFGLPKIPTGDAGNLTISTPLLKVFDEGVVTVENQGTGSSGILTIKADNLILNESGTIGSAAESGFGGNITLDTKNLSISNDSKITAAAGGEGNGGNITINTTNLNAKKKSQITSSSFEGDGGNIDINASDSISFKDQNNVTARSEFGNGGNIEINSERTELDSSNISASAGGTGNGGNITVNSDIFTVLDNSSITANAVEGNGGNINITAEGFFVSPDSTITATSELGIDGEVNIETLSNDIEKELNPSELSVEDLSVAIAKTCLSNQRATFKEGSTTGLPLDPNSQYRNLDFSLTGFGSLPVISSEENSTSFDEESLIPATHMIETPDGEIYLVSSLQEAQDLICSKTN